ncbi:hypothetical protein WJX84_001603 [Apatococcus fuscideae]|uniref:F-box domain-containing protein n=1 Tax=Apatococcus fuscideae TaxID=2026836 RepID=A0AAW1SP59_9CHLO
MDVSPLDSCPPDVLLQILSRVDFETRLTSIPLVCKRWKGLAHSSLWRDCKICHRDYADTLKYIKVRQWLERYGNAIRTMEMSISTLGGLHQAWSGGAAILLHLTPHLQSLSIHDYEGYFLAPDSEDFAAAQRGMRPQVLACLTHLTVLRHLELDLGPFTSILSQSRETEVMCLLSDRTALKLGNFTPS